MLLEDTLTTEAKLVPQRIKDSYMAKLLNQWLDPQAELGHERRYSSTLLM